MPVAGDIFVGRAAELGQLAAALDSASAGRGRLVLLSGEPGIGKTRVVAELANQAETAGVPVLWGHCHQEPGAPPYWPWTQVVRALAATIDDAALAAHLGVGAPDILDLIPELRSRLADPTAPVAASDPAQARFRLFASLSRFMVAAARRQPLVVVLDDAHWADAPSLRLLRFLAPDLGVSRILVIVTYRENELSRRHPLSDALGDLTRVGAVSRLRLNGLTSEEAGDLMAATAGARPAPSLVRSLHAQTEGNPLFLREIVRFLDQRGLLSAARGAQPIALPPTLRIPEGVREVIGQRLNLLSHDCNAVLQVASVIGREFDLDLLRRARGGMAEAVSAALDDALSARVVEEGRSGRYQFTHALIRMTLYDELRAGERRRLHRAVGEALEATHRRDPDPVLPELARHFHQAGGDVARALDYAARAGRRADAALAFEDAAEFFEAALDLLLQQDEPDPHRQCELLLHLGNAQRKAGDFDQARGTLRAAVDLARQQGLTHLLADAAIGIELSTWRDGDIREDTADLLREALASLPPTELPRRIAGMGALARARLYAGAVAEAKAIALDAVALARQHGDPAVIARSMTVQLSFPAAPEETRARLADALEMAELAERAGEIELAIHATYQVASYQLELGAMEDCHRSTDRLRELDRQLRQAIFFLYEIGFRTTLALLRGALAEAEQLIREGLRLRTPGTLSTVDPLSVLIFSLRREQGRLQEVGPLLQAFAGKESATIWQPGLALLHVELGDTEAARALFEAMAADEFAALPRDGRWTTCLAYLAEVCAALGDAPRAAVLYPLLLPWAGRNLIFGNGTGCAGAADRLLGLLATTLRHWTDAERHLVNAAAMNGRTGALAPLAHTWYDHAMLLLARGFPGDPGRAAELLHRAQESASTLGLVALARQAEARLAKPKPAPAAPDELTAREIEVLRLIAMGRTNADIGLVLEIGVNTVATHVRNILAKTGCANRTEAAAYALRQPGLSDGLS